jgi:hypothetical protein
MEAVSAFRQIGREVQGVPVADDFPLLPCRGGEPAEVRFGVVLCRWRAVLHEMDEHLVVVLDGALRPPIEEHIQVLTGPHALGGQVIAEQLRSDIPFRRRARDISRQVGQARLLERNGHAPGIGAEIAQTHQGLVVDVRQSRR